MTQVNQNTPSSMAKLLKHSMKTPSNNSLRKKKPDPSGPSKQEYSTLSVFDKLFLDAQGTMTTPEDKETLAVLKSQVSSYIGTTLGAEPFLKPKEDKKNPWKETKKFYQQMKVDIFGPKRSDPSPPSPRSIGKSEASSDQESRGGEGDDYQVVRNGSRRPKNKNKKSYRSELSDRSHHAGDFYPKKLERLSEDAFCVPLFFPSEESYEIFHSALSSAKKTLYVCIFSLTDNDTARVLSNAYQRGLDVRIITDNDQMDPTKGADVRYLNERYGIPLKYDNSDQFMHNKFAVIDDKTVITGSFNWSAGARYKNRENVVITNIPSVVDAFAIEFDKLWDSF
ncbi:hypothetical protein G6F56_011548 [Rhizopus delemar]|nr:hypothetical protein G6F56_011548 [Rhizopus delemar]